MKNRFILALIALMFYSASFAQVKDIISDIKNEFCPDKRVAIWEITEKKENKTIILEGKTDNAKAKAALLSALKEKGIKYKDLIKMLPDAELPGKWGFCNTPYAHMRGGQGHAYELVSQCLMGNPLRILEKGDGWLRVQTPDNYIAWISSRNVQIISDNEFEAWKNSERYVVTAIYTYMYSNPECTEVESDLVMGDILTGKKYNNNLMELFTPDGRKGYTKIEEVQELKDWANQPLDVNKILETAHMLKGSVYTWGGTSTKGVDCSGLTKTSYFSNAIILQRDASQQVKYGKKIDPRDWGMAKKGDLLYFGTKSGRVTHTAIYIEDGKYIHASGSGRVKINSVDPQSELYLTTPFISINRIENNVDKAGIQSVKNHKWYFNN